MQFKRLYIQFNRYGLRKKFMRVMAGTLRGYWFTTERSYEYLLGNYEDPTTLETFMSACGKGTVFYDLGAAAGYYTLIADRCIDAGTILCFEPFTANRDLLKAHLELNKERLKKSNGIRVLPYALSDENKTIAFSNDPVQTDGNTYIKTSPSFKENAEPLMVTAYALDNWVAAGNAPPNIIKIDVEGAEYDVLKGAEKTILQYRPLILLATHDCHLPGVKDKCISLLTGWGYKLQHTGNYNQQVGGLDDFIAKPGGVEGG